jgi:hypothetical protein
MPVDLEAKLAELCALWDGSVAPVDVAEILGCDTVEVGDLDDLDDRGGDPPRRAVRSVWLVTAAAALVAVLVGALVWLAGDDDSAPSHPSGSTELPGTRAARAAWAPAGQLNYPCSGCWAGLLDDGRVVVTGGLDEQEHAVVELWDPATATFTVAARSGESGWQYTGGEVLGDGRVVLTTDRDPGSRVSVFDPDTSTITELAGLDGLEGAEAQESLWFSSPVALENDRLLVFRNVETPSGPDGIRHEVLSIDMATGAVSTIAEGRGAAGWADQLPDGRVAVLSRAWNPTAVNDRDRLGVLDPSTGQYTQTAPLSMRIGGPQAAFSSLTVLADGRVLVVGIGMGREDGHAAVVFDPDTGELTATGPMAYAREALATTVRLADGRVLVLGVPDGVGGGETPAEIYDPATGLFSPAPAPLGQRYSPAAVVLDANRILVIGDYAGSAEVLALDGDAGLPAGCCPPATRDVVVDAAFDAGDLEVPEGGRVEAVINVAANQSRTDPPVSIRALIHIPSEGGMVDVPLPSGCSPYTAPEVFAPPGAVTTDPGDATVSCELVVPLGQTDSAALTVFLSYVGPPPITADQVTVSFRVADEDDE